MVIYVERTDSVGNVRAGIVGKIDLEQYDYSKKSTSFIRATEATVAERIPARVEIRNNAVVELPHVMLLVDDAGKHVIEPCEQEKEHLPLLYDFDLMMGGGHLCGYLLGKEEKKRIEKALTFLADPILPVHADSFLELLVGSAEESLKGKTLAEVDVTTMAGGARWAIQTILEHYPKCRVFVCTPIQTGDVTRNERNLEKIAILREICRALSVQLIDCYSNSGITEKFEQPSGRGR